MVVGTVGIVVPVLPGLIVVWGATLVWAFARQDGPGWLVFGIATVLYAVGLVAKYVLPGRRMKSAGVDGAVVAVALAEHREHRAAWRATGQAIRAVGLNIGIELATAFAIIATWGVAVYVASS